VACVTAAFVLLFNVYCACAHSAAAGPHDDGGGNDLPPCHAHRAAGTHGTPSQSPTPTGKLPCQHCKSAFASETAKQAAPLQPFLPAWGVATTPAEVVQLAAASHDVALALDLPPPRPAASLLSLHCALNTCRTTAGGAARPFCVRHAIAS
jgi:hypothetical protein